MRRITSSAFSPRQNVSVFSGSMARARCQAKQRKCTCRRRDVIVLSAHRRCPTPQTRRGLSIRHCPDRRAHARTDAPPGLRRNTPASRARVSGVIYVLAGWGRGGALSAACSSETRNVLLFVLAVGVGDVHDVTLLQPPKCLYGSVAALIGRSSQQQPRAGCSVAVFFTHGSYRCLIYD